MNGGGSATSATSNTENVPDITPMVVSAPVISGTPAVGSTLNASTGAFVGGGLTYSYLWLRDGSPISGATGATYTVVAADAGHALSVQVTATNARLRPGHERRGEHPRAEQQRRRELRIGCHVQLELRLRRLERIGILDGVGLERQLFIRGQCRVSASRTRSPRLILRLAALKLPRLKKLLKSGLALTPSCTVACILTIRLTVERGRGDKASSDQAPDRRRGCDSAGSALGRSAPRARHSPDPERSPALAGAGTLTATLTVIASGGGATRRSPGRSPCESRIVCGAAQSATIVDRGGPLARAAVRMRQQSHRDRIHAPDGRAAGLDVVAGLGRPAARRLGHASGAAAVGRHRRPAVDLHRLARQPRPPPLNPPPACPPAPAARADLQRCPARHASRGAWHAGVHPLRAAGRRAGTGLDGRLHRSRDRRRRPGLCPSAHG